tara:strand:+ start:262 stop:531 length:270 start_codon:yes stop_codon:yes gene_type:complete
MNVKIREFYIYTDEGNDTWNWELDQTDQVFKDYLEYKNDPSFTIEIQDWTDEEYEYVEIFPKDEGISNFPKHVQKSIHKVLNQIRQNHE